MLTAQTGTLLSDQDLEKRVMNCISRLYFDASRVVEVQASQGLITLQGKVPSFHHRQLCLEAAKRVDGVAAIQDNITVISDVARAMVPNAPIRLKCGQSLAIA
jgi:osmotically-inducible protein OsmY